VKKMDRLFGDVAESVIYLWYWFDGLENVRKKSAIHAIGSKRNLCNNSNETWKIKK
jgi:hypothetical protein